ncbi:MAG: A/G-specific adenine glycosylase [Cellulosilyticaceae bacterium]
MNYADRLLEWFDQNKREMPWRNTSDPYSIWVSEVMLQQTQVDTVIPYYEKFMERFPTVVDLADASLEEVHNYWQGLGYYRRAENLHKGAKVVATEYGGVFPKDPKEVKRIPGIGPYTLGAVLSIAFRIPLPAVDGNVMRILSRQFMIDADISITKNKKIFEDKVMELMPSDPNRFNQALMELGALICTPKNPKCTSCPIQPICEAHQWQRELDFPVKTQKIKVVTEKYRVILIEKDGKYWMEKRSSEGLLAKLWGFPMIEEKEWVKKYEKEVTTFPMEGFTHVFTHKKWELTPIIIDWTPEVERLLGSYVGEENQFVTIEEMSGLPIGTAFTKIIDKLEDIRENGYNLSLLF